MTENVIAIRSLMYNPDLMQHHRQNTEAILNAGADVDLESNGVLLLKVTKIRKTTDREKVFNLLKDNPTTSALMLNTDTMKRVPPRGFVSWPDYVAKVEAAKLAPAQAEQTAPAEEAPIEPVAEVAPVEVVVEAPAAKPKPKAAKVEAHADAELPAIDNDNQNDGGGADGDAGAGGNAESNTDDELPQDAPTEPSEPLEENLSLIEARLRAAKQRHAVLQEFNERYSVVNAAGTAMIFSDEYDPALERKVYRYMKPTDLRLLYLNRSVCTHVDAKDDGKPDSKYGKVADFWLKHKDRRQYVGGVVFDPSGRANSLDVLNLWRGFSVKPKQGSWEKLKSHVRTNICCGNKLHFDYMMGWMARLIQYPGKRGEVAVVLRGGLGVGKGILGNALCALFHQHAMHIASSKHLVGNFNLHLRDCVMLFSDEAFFAGDKQGVGTLKSLITEEHLTIEPKGQNASQSPNYLHIIMASNESWVIPAAIDERRFFVLDVSNEHKQDKPYFAAITKELESGGYEAMLWDLMHFDLSSFEVRDVPETKALQDQKKLSLESSHAWWNDCLLRGHVHKSRFGLEHEFGQWRDFVATALLYDSYREFSKGTGERHPMTREMFGRFIKKMGGKPMRPREGIIGERMTPSGADFVREVRPYGFHLGSLDAAREAFEKATGLTVEWPEGGDEGGEA